jgi:hypothetical protein
MQAVYKDGNLGLEISVDDKNDFLKKIKSIN